MVMVLFCRWLEDKPVTERQVDPKIVRYWENLPKSKRPSSKSYPNVLSAVTDNLTPARLHFLAMLLVFSNRFSPSINVTNRRFLFCIVIF